MDITRRKLLKVLGTSSLGTVLFNACRWPETELFVQSPVEIPEDMVKGIDTFYATQCRQYPGGSGIVVRVMEGRAKKVEGNPDFPTNRGKHGARSEAVLQALYHPDRVRTPLRRDGERGSGVFSPISWDEAHNELVSRLQNDGNRSLMVTGPLTGLLARVVSGFTKTSGVRHVALEPMEQTVLRRAMKEVFQQDRLPDLDIGNCEYLLSFGADFLGTWGAPIRYAQSYGEFRQGEHRKKRGTFVQVDSHFSMTTANADEWVPIKPGMEGLLAMSMSYVIISEGLGNPGAASEMTGGDGVQALEAFRPDAVAQRIGVSAKRIHDLAIAFATHRPSMAIGGDSAAAHSNGLFNLKAIYSLNYLVESVNSKGGIIFNPAPPATIPDTLGGATYEKWRSLVAQMRDGQVSTLIIQGANPVHALPGILNTAEAVNQVPFIAAFATVIDETATMADIILPEHTPFEEWGADVPDPAPGYQAVGFVQPVVQPLYESRSFGDEILLAGKDLGLDLPWTNMKEALEKISADLHSLDQGSIRATDIAGFWNGALQRGGWWNTNAKAPSGSSKPPRLLEKAENPSFAGSETEFPFHLTVYRSLALAEGQNAHLPWLQATPDPITTVVWQTWVEINTKTAEELGLREGDIVNVESPAGSLQVPVYPHPAVPPYMVAIPAGQGHSVYGRYAKGRGANVFSILADVTDSQTGSLAWGATRVRLQKTGEFRMPSKFEGMVPPFQLKEAVVVKVTRGK